MRRMLFTLPLVTLAIVAGVATGAAAQDTKTARGTRPYVFTDLLRQRGLHEVIAFIEKAGGLS